MRRFKPKVAAAGVVGSAAAACLLLIAGWGTKPTALLPELDAKLVSTAVAQSSAAPIARAGRDLRAALGEVVVLDGGSSTDAGGDLLTYSWNLTSVPTGSLAALSNASAIRPSFEVDLAGDYVAQLVVNDGTQDSLADTVVVSTDNVAPVADAGAGQTAALGATTKLDATASSDADGDRLTYAWTLTQVPSGSAAALSDASAPRPSFTVDLDGTYIASLTVDDGVTTSTADEVRISTTNSPPVADAGPEQRAAVGDTLRMRVDRSLDVDGDLISRFNWSLIAKPATSTAALTPTDGDGGLSAGTLPALTLDQPGTYVVQLTVDTDAGSSQADTAVITTENAVPLADAGPDRSVLPGDFVVLGGGGSSDRDGDVLTYRWALLHAPTGSTAALDDPVAVAPGFTADLAGTYIAQLIVSDGTRQSAPDTAVITTGNARPFAAAGSDQRAGVGTTVQLDGSASGDADGDALTYDWNLIGLPSGGGGGGFEVLNPQAGTGSIPGYTVGAGDNRVLIVGVVTNTPSTSSLAVHFDGVALKEIVNTPSFVLRTALFQLKEADIGPGARSGNITVAVSGSTPSVAEITAFYMTGIDQNRLARTNLGKAPFFGTLTSTDGTLTPLSDETVMISILGLGTSVTWTPGAGETQINFRAGTGAAIGASFEEAPLAVPVTMSWSGPAATTPTILMATYGVATPGGGGGGPSLAELDDPTLPNPSFLPDLKGTYVAQLIVNDGGLDSVPDIVLASTENGRPAASAGTDQVANTGDLVTLDGLGSSDPDGDSLTYAWSLLHAPEGSTAALSDPSAAQPSFTADLVGSYVAQLIVAETAGEQLKSDPATVVVTVLNTPPLADAGPDQVVRTRSLAQLDGSGSSDPDGDALSFAWMLVSQPVGSTAALRDPNAIDASLIPDLPGDYVIDLVVSDGLDSSTPDSVTITATDQAPIADAGPDQSVQPGTAVNLDGSASSDPDGQPLSFSWRFTAQPSGSTASLVGADTATPSFTADVAGIYIAELTVSDGAFDSTDTVAVRAISPSSNNAPALDPIGNQTVALGTTLALTLTASDPDGDDLGFSATPLPLPAGASLESASGVFLYRPQPSELGTNTITFAVSDGLASDSESVSITVTDGPAGPTALSGRVLDAVDLAAGTETPVVGATVSVVGATVSVVTDATGSFTLGSLPAGNPLVDIDGTTANLAPDGSAYAGLRQSVDVVSGVTNAPAQPFALARIDAGSLTTVDPTTTTVVQNATLGVTLTIPPGSAKNPDGTDFTGQASVSDAIADAASVPSFLSPCQLITVQPAGLTFDPPAQISFPNLDNLVAGSEVDLWFLDPTTGSFTIVGVGTVSADGTIIDTTSGGIPASGLVTAAAPAPVTARSSDDNGFNFTPTTLADGNLNTSFSLPSYNSLGQARTRTFVYNSTLAAPAPIVAAESTLLARGGIPGLVEAELEVGSTRVAGPVFTTTATPADPADPGLSESADELLRTALQFDASGLPTGSYPYRFISTGNFGCTRISTASAGRVFVRNETESPFGTGWTLEELQRLFPQDDGSFVLTEGDGTTLRFEAFKRVNGTTGAVVEVIDLPQSVRPNVLEDSDNLIVFNEQRNFALPMPVTLNAVNPRTFSSNGQLQNRPLPAGAIVNSYFAHFDIVGTTGDLTRSGTVTFDEDILGVILLDADLNTSDLILGRDDLAYPEPGESSLRGLEFGANDRITISPDRRTLTVTSRTTTGADQFRVVTLGDTDPGDIISSFFDVDGEGWTVFGDADGPFYEATDGNPGGHIRVDDQVTGISWFFNAPAKFLGDISRFYNGRLSFDLRQAPTNDQFPTGNDVDLIGAGLRLFIETGYNPLTDWTRYSITILREDAGWIVDGEDRPPTRTEFLAVLADLQELRIRGEYQVGTDTGRLDNVVLLRLPTAPQLADFRAPAGDFSTLAANPDGTFSRRLKDGTQITFDADGFMTAVADRNGNTTSYDYDPDGNLTKITDPVLLETTFGYTAGRLTSVTDPAGRTTGFLIDAGGNLITTTNADGTLKRFVYDSNDRLVEDASERGFVTKHDYGFAGQFAGSGFPDGASIAINISKSLGLADLGLGTEGNPAPFGRPQNGISELTDARGNIWKIRVNEFGSLVEISDPVGRITSFLRNADNLVTEIAAPSDGELPDGAVPGSVTTQIDYGAVGNIISQSDAVGTTLERQTKFEYEPVFNNVIKITDPASFETTFSYDVNGNLTKSVNPIGSEATPTRLSTYNARGLELTRQDARGNSTQFAYDLFGNLEKITDAEGNETKFQRDTAGRITATTEGFGTQAARTTGLEYDAMNRVVSKTDGEGGITKTTYDAAGNVTESLDPTGRPTTTLYDPRNRITELIDPIEGVLSLEYDGNGNVKTLDNGAGDRFSFVFDAVNRLEKSVDPLLNQRSFSYHRQSKLKTVTDTRGNTERFDYDLLDRKIRRSNRLSQISVFGYDNRDNLTSSLDAKGQAISAVYDALSRLTQVTTPDDALAFSYDPLGNLLTADDGDSSLVFTYDGLSRPLSAKTGTGGVQPVVTLSSSYDAVGNRNQLSSTIGNTTNFSHDDAGRLVSLTTPNNNQILLQYDTAGRLENVFFPNSTNFQISYDLNGRPEVLSHQQNSLSFAQFEYAYVGDGFVESIVEPTGTRTFNYDALQQLVSGGFASSPETYSYDSEGNRTTSHLSTSHSHNAANQIIEDDLFCYSYDLNGNLIARTGKVSGLCTGSSTSYTYDARNQLVRIDFAGGGLATYRYDAIGRRIEKNVDGVVNQYIYDGLEIFMEFDGTGSLIGHYLHGNELDKRLVAERGSDAFFYHVDRLGSVRKLTDAAGAVVNSYDYDSFGNFESRTESVDNPFAFTGREFDAESGLYYYRARYYDPNAGRFLSEDPIGFAAGDFNLYRYVSNNPANAQDATGLSPIQDFLRVLGSVKARAAVGLIRTAQRTGGIFGRVATKLRKAVIKEGKELAKDARKSPTRSGADFLAGISEAYAEDQFPDTGGPGPGDAAEGADPTEGRKSRWWKLGNRFGTWLIRLQKFADFLSENIPGL